jgi:HlyD family secretion protein
MEPANKPPVKGKDELVVEFLPDADEMERSPLPRGTRFTLHVMLVAFVVAILWASLSHVEEIVTAHGRIVTPLPNVIVQPLETSIIQSITVRLGQVVKKGDPLATLDPTFTQADEAQLRSRLESVDHQISSLEHELAGEPVRGVVPADPDEQLQSRLAAERKANYAAQIERLNETIGKLEASLVTNAKDVQTLQARMRSLSEIEGMQEKLVAQQFGAKLQLLQARSNRLEVERDLQLAIHKDQEIRRDLAVARADKDAFDKGWRQKATEDLLNLTRERDDVGEQLAKANKRHALVNLVAPSDGVVLDIAKLSPGSVIKEADTFFTIVPTGGPLEAEVQVDSIDVGHIRPGNTVHLKLDAFPYQKHGTLEGKLRTLSEDSFKRDTPAGQGTDAYYLARVSYGGTLKGMTDHARVLPGMTVTAEIVVGRRTVMSYLLWPLTKALDESIREP